MSKGIPVAVLVARLEHELETAFFALKADLKGETGLAVTKAQALAKQIREAL